MSGLVSLSQGRGYVHFIWSCMDTFLTPPFSLNLMLKTQDGITVGNVLRGLNILDQGLSAGCSLTAFSISSTRTCARLGVGVSVTSPSCQFLSLHVCVSSLLSILKLGYGGAATTYWMMKKCSGADCYNVLSWSRLFSKGSPSASILVTKK